MIGFAAGKPAWVAACSRTVDASITSPMAINPDETLRIRILLSENNTVLAS